MKLSVTLINSVKGNLVLNSVYQSKAVKNEKSGIILAIWNYEQAEDDIPSAKIINEEIEIALEKGDDFEVRHCIIDADNKLTNFSSQLLAYYYEKNQWPNYERFSAISKITNFDSTHYTLIYSQENKSPLLNTTSVPLLFKQLEISPEEKKFEEQSTTKYSY